MVPILIANVGLISYAEGVRLQERLAAARKANAIEDVLLFCEHPHVITLGRSGSRANLLASENVLRQKGVELFGTNRGGDITYHGPGQIVGYPILNLDSIRRDVHWYVRSLEQAMIAATAEFGITAFPVTGKTGIWVKHAEAEEKLAAIGVHISRWVTSHGFAYNVATDLRYFDLIIPCGIADRKATSLEKLLDRPVTLAEVRPRIAEHIARVFSRETQDVTRAELVERLERSELRRTESFATGL